MFNKIALSLSTALILTQPAFAKPKSLDDKLLDATIAYADKPSAKKMQVIDKLLAQGAKPHYAFPMNEDGPEIATPLGLAIYINDPTLAHKLLEAKPNLALPISVSWNMAPLMYAMIPTEMTAKQREARHTIIKDLLAHGANPNVKSEDGNTPLMIAGGVVQTQQPNLEHFNELLKYGANVNARNDYGDGPLTSMGASNLAIIKLMLSSKANVKKPNNYGQNAMHFVCTRYFKTVANAPDKDAAERIHLLKSVGLNINGMPTQQGVSALGNPLYMALHEKNPDCVRELLKQGASPDMPAAFDTHGKTLTLRQWLKTEGKGFLGEQKVPADLRKQLL
ncbi:ankyrin repeat domain-containing protein [Chromobacterium sp. IIBBL 290-4]|uniref:ankyrin repeat domain-containing protein n=1 Tax=Chromobacterium sp. IIBBL 290-4 TaxID=2953890 RepID=UPI0020B8CA92|nr:hypothetical protein [Chromobacterium sp. IIBBL 290-4]UTH76595.1 hypothetical protein NKT35_11055 [Chromobacterium sp. IIBBL 290-4]